MSAACSRAEEAPALYLAYSRPAWMDGLERHPPTPLWQRRRRLKVRLHGNVAHVGWKPLGFCLVELRPGEWTVAWFNPAARWVTDRCSPFSKQGAGRAFAQEALNCLSRSERRPLHPAIPLCRSIDR